jgi:hypothetical protein
MECGWLLIYERLRKLDKLENYRKLREPRDNRKDRGKGVRRMVLAEMTENEEASDG